MHDINIVFVNLRMAADIVQAVDSVIKDIAGSPYAVQITVVDNSNNSDGIREQLKLFPNVQYIDAGGNVGFGKGNTIGFKATPARYYFALNRDTIIKDQSRTIERLIKFMDDHSRIGCIGPKLLNLDGSLQYSCYRFDLRSMLIKPLRHLQWDSKYAWVKRSIDRLLMRDFDHGETRPVDWVLGAAMVVRREVVEQIGWFDERYFAYLEDADWCRTMWANGWPVYYVHDIAIMHGHARASAKVPGLLMALIKNPTARIHAKSWLQYLWKWKKSFRFIS